MAVATSVKLATVLPGATLLASDLGMKTISPIVRDALGRRCLGLCKFTQKVHHIEDMRERCLSHDGFRGSVMLANARTQASRHGFPFDQELIRKMARGPLPKFFNGVPYVAECVKVGGWRVMGLSINRINPRLGYVRGNVRFIPVWLNRVLGVFSDQKAERIFERMAGCRPQLKIAKTVPVESQKMLRQFVRSKKIRAKHAGAPVSKDFDFTGLLAAGKLSSACPYSGVTFAWEGMPSGGCVRSPSVDRIAPGGHYCVENVQLVSNEVNRMKSNIPVSHMREVLSALSFLRTEEYLSLHVPPCVRVARPTAQF